MFPEDNDFLRLPADYGDLVQTYFATLGLGFVQYFDQGLNIFICKCT